MGHQTYRAVVCEQLSGPEQLVVRELTREPLPSGNVRIALKAAGLNFPDLLMTYGRYQHRPQLPFVPGMEASGVIAEVAPDVTGVAVGESVIVQLRTGGFAEEVVAPASHVVMLPDGFSFAGGATLLVAHKTAYHALVTRAGIAAGQSLLVLGAAGGVGLAAVQIGKALGARVLAAASSGHKLQVAHEHGASGLIDYTAQKIEDAVKRLTDGSGVDIVLDPVGIAQEQALRCVAPGGKLLIAGFAGGSIPAYAANRILLKGCSVIGVRAGEAGRQDPAMRRHELCALQELAAQGRVRPLVSATFPLVRCADALQLLAERRAIGRIALDLTP